MSNKMLVRICPDLSVLAHSRERPDFLFLYISLSVLDCNEINLFEIFHIYNRTCSKINDKINYKATYVLVSASRGVRFYAMSLVPGERAIVGAAFSDKINLVQDSAIAISSRFVALLRTCIC